MERGKPIAVHQSQRMKVCHSSASFLICVSYISLGVDSTLVPKPDVATSNYCLINLGRATNHHANTMPCSVQRDA